MWNSIVAKLMRISNVAKDNVAKLDGGARWFLHPKCPSVDMWALGCVMAEHLAAETVPGRDRA
jgi:hypothetical protein